MDSISKVRTARNDQSLRTLEVALREAFAVVAQSRGPIADGCFITVHLPTDCRCLYLMEHVEASDVVVRAVLLAVVAKLASRRPLGINGLSPCSSTGGNLTGNPTQIRS